MQNGSLHYADWLATYDGLRQSPARLINAAPEEIALMKNTSEGIATIAMGLDWRAGDTDRRLHRGVPGQPISLAASASRKA